MITHEPVIGYPHACKRSLLFSAASGAGPEWLAAGMAASAALLASPCIWACLLCCASGAVRPHCASGQRHQVRQFLTPRVLHAVGQQHDPLRAERLDRALIVRDENDRPLE